MRVSANFVTSATAPSGFPKERLPELAFAGRSNVGKSSLINALVRQKIARTSAAPGKTRLANFYRVAAEGLAPFHLVDLPGYGYARAPQARNRRAAAQELADITGGYFQDRRGLTPFSMRPAGKKGADPSVYAREGSDPVLAAVLLLIDSRHPGLDSDLQAGHWLQSLNVPREIVATKLDKLTRAERTRNLKEIERLHEGPVLGVSAQTGEGLKQLWELIATRLRP